MMTPSKARDPIRRFAWSAANWAANNAFELIAFDGTIGFLSRFDGADESYISQSHRIDRFNSSKWPYL